MQRVLFTVLRTESLAKLETLEGSCVTTISVKCTPILICLDVCMRQTRKVYSHSILQLVNSS